MKFRDIALDADLTAASTVLIQRAREYLVGDEVVDALYQHAADLEVFALERQDTQADVEHHAEEIEDLKKEVKELEAEVDSKRAENTKLRDKLSAVISQVDAARRAAATAESFSTVEGLHEIIEGMARRLDEAQKAAAR